MAHSQATARLLRPPWPAGYKFVMGREKERVKRKMWNETPLTLQRSGSKNVGLCLFFFNRRLLYCCTLNLLASLSSQPQWQATQYLCSTVKPIRQFYDYSSHTFVLSSVIDLIQLHHVRCYWPRLINRNPCIMSKHC